MTLQVSIRKQLGAFGLDAAFESRGRLTALFGASGSGKTTLVDLIAGLGRPDRGRIAVDGRVLVDTDRGVFVPPHRRRVGYVFQDNRLFPHLTVKQNLRYGRFFAPANRHAGFDEVVDLLGVGHLLDRRPAGLSGGERSRVAIGRALLAAPELLLMDEPLASLDEGRRLEILPFIERLRDERGVPIVYVSHSAAEVARLATDVAVLREGRVSAHGPAEEVLARLDLLPPGERDEAGALVALTVVAHDERWGLTLLRSSAGEWRLPRLDAEPGTVLRVRVRARDVMVALAAPERASALNALAGTVTEVTPGGDAEALVAILCGADRLLARVTRFSAHALGLVPGREVFAVVKSVVFDPSNAAARAPAPPPG